MRAALARLRLSRMIASSMMFSLTGGQVGCTTKTSRPRTSSSMRARNSPSGKFCRVILPSESPRHCAIFSASAIFARPLNTFSLLLYCMVWIQGAEATVITRKNHHDLLFKPSTSGGNCIFKPTRMNCQQGRGRFFGPITAPKEVVKIGSGIRSWVLQHHPSFFLIQLVQGKICSGAKTRCEKRIFVRKKLRRAVATWSEDFILLRLFPYRPARGSQLRFGQPSPLRNLL